MFFFCLVCLFEDLHLPFRFCIKLCKIIFEYGVEAGVKVSIGELGEKMNLDVIEIYALTLTKIKKESNLLPPVPV